MKSSELPAFAWRAWSAPYGVHSHAARHCHVSPIPGVNQSWQGEPAKIAGSSHAGVALAPHFVLRNDASHRTYHALLVSLDRHAEAAPPAKHIVLRCYIDQNNHDANLSLIERVLLP